METFPLACSLNPKLKSLVMDLFKDQLSYANTLTGRILSPLFLSIEKRHAFFPSAISIDRWNPNSETSKFLETERWTTRGFPVNSRRISSGAFQADLGISPLPLPPSNFLLWTLLHQKGEREIGTKVRWRWLPPSWSRDGSCRLDTISGLFLALSFPDTIDSVLSIFRHSKLCQSLFFKRYVYR